jgi:hypothetical protein
MHRFSIEEYAQTSILSSICSAIVEDAMGLGNRPLPEVLRCLKGMRGHRLPQDIIHPVKSIFGLDANTVRLHTGQRANKLLALVGAPACCIGPHILLGESILARSATVIPVLLHELAHIAAVQRDDRLRCWNAKGHADLSAAACETYRLPLETLATAVNLQWPELIRGIRNASSNMDYRGRVRHADDFAVYVLHKVKESWGSKGEGPPHGEGFNYAPVSEEANRRRNIAEQNWHAQKAAEEFRKDEPLLQIGDHELRVRNFRSGPLPTHFMNENAYGVSMLERAWIKSLANALHIAQDRAAHREGRQGYGHDDPRYKNKTWHPDVVVHEHQDSAGEGWYRCNKAAYNMALNNSGDVIREFLMRINLGTNASITIPARTRKPVRCP